MLQDKRVLTVGFLMDEPAAPMPPAKRDAGYLLAGT